jgi:hypothetical protein
VRTSQKYDVTKLWGFLCGNFIMDSHHREFAWRLIRDLVLCGHHVILFVASYLCDVKDILQYRVSNLHCLCHVAVFTTKK